MKDTSRNKLLRIGVSVSFGAMLTLVTAVMFTIKSVDIPIWAWIIEFALVSGITFVIPRQPRAELTSEQKRLLLFSSIAAILLIIALVIIIAVS